MTFAYPWVLLLLVLPILLMIRSVRHETPGLTLPFDYRHHRPRRFSNFALRAVALLPALVLAAVILLLARPQVLRVPRQDRVLTNIQICLDVSGSMSSGDRYLMAAEAIRKVTLAREGDAIGFTLFGSEQIRWTPLTRDLQVIRRALPFANPRKQPPGMGGTRIGAALKYCRDNMLVESEEGDRLMILVSDGHSSDLGGGAAGEIAMTLVDSDITLYHIHVGTAAVPGEVNEIAQETGGEAFVADNQDGLIRVFSHIDRMQPDRFKPAAAVATDWPGPFAWFGLGALGLHVLGLLGVRYTPW